MSINATNETVHVKGTNIDYHELRRPVSFRAHIRARHDLSLDFPTLFHVKLAFDYHHPTKAMVRQVPPVRPNEL